MAESRLSLLRGKQERALRRPFFFVGRDQKCNCASAAFDLDHQLLAQETGRQRGPFSSCIAAAGQCFLTATVFVAEALLLLVSVTVSVTE